LRPSRILVGDGRSDFCCAARAGVVFARSSLSLHCWQNDVAFLPFEDFQAVRRFVEQKLDGARPPAVAAVAEGARTQP
jgi:2-hydroxy-3-keto-5-methylthiopentenyl-1-phosphate phosphatase